LFSIELFGCLCVFSLFKNIPVSTGTDVTAASDEQ